MLRGGWWWKFLAEALTGGGRQRRREMNRGRGGGAEEGSGAGEISSSPIPTPPSGHNDIADRSPLSGEIAERPLDCQEIAVSQGGSGFAVDFFSQARKALCLRSPFDADDALSSVQTTPASSSAGVVSTTFLPSGLAQLLSKHSDGGSRKRHKRPHSGGEQHKGRAEKSRGSNIWVETEEYFRELTVEDIAKLDQDFNLGFSGSDECSAIPALDTSGSLCNLCVAGNSSNSGFSNGGFGLDDKGCAVREEAQEGDGTDEGIMAENDGQFLDVDIIGDGNGVGKANEEGKVVKKLEKGVNGVAVVNGLEWLLGSRSKIYLTSERPSKKRKLLSGDAGLDKLLVTRPAEGSSSLCHYCSVGDTGDLLNRLIVCCSCGVSVHQRCYGVQNHGDGTWMCSWCNQKKDGQSIERPCLLCPKKGGALKPAQKRDDEVGVVEYAHLFCCQWAPEVYVEDIRTMEPIMNIDGINDTRRKLVCCLCKVKCGACVRCSNGACRTAFHPLCSREAQHRMEIWGRLGCDEVELRAFCAKHSEAENDAIGQCTGDTVAIDSDSKNDALIPSGNKTHKLKLYRRNGDNVEVDINVYNDKIDDQMQMDELLDNKSNSRISSDVIDVQNDATEMNLTEDETSVPLNFNMILKKLIDQKEVDLKDLAEEFGLSPDSLATLLAGNHVVPNLNGKFETWLKDNGYISSLPKPLRVKIKSATSLNAEAHVATSLGTNTVIEAGTDGPMIGPSDKAVAIGRIPENASAKGECFSEQSDIAPSGTKRSILPGHAPSRKESDSSYTHPLIQHKLIGEDNGFEYDGLMGREFSQLGASSSSGICCNHHSQQATDADWISKLNGVNLEGLVKARNMGMLRLSPSDEVEGELIYYQQKLLANAVKRKQFMNDLISKVANNLQQEIDAARKQKWDAVLLSQYLYELREAKKHGRKERRHKEAQAVLAAATAAAAASSRISSLRKDAIEEAAHMEDLPKDSFSNGRPGLYSNSQQFLRVKEIISRSAAARLSSEKNSDPFSLASDFSAEQPKVCEICGRCETILNMILVCSSCKVAVHLDCYRSVKNSTGPWYCELCDDLLSCRGSNVSCTNSWDKPYVIAECGLCGGTAGAFRKSIAGQWIHAFCAEWVLESTFKRGQINPVDGMEAFSKGVDICVICSRRKGVCVKCSYGNCQSTFHASCARSTGYYMNVRTSGGKLQRKAYCGKHSSEQRAKAETQKHGAEEFKSIKQIRVELERLRLLCERIIKREKLKRELVLCSHDILASNRDNTIWSALSRHPLYHPGLSSESATASTRGYTDGNKSGSDTIQRLDDITIDSTVAGKRRIKLPMYMDSDHKTNDSSVSQHFMTQTQKPIERLLYSGKQVPHRPAVASRNFTEDAEKRSRFKKHPETFEKELVMTSDQASIKNQRLPKGFVYVPIRCLAKDKETVPEPCSRESLEHNR